MPRGVYRRRSLPKPPQVTEALSQLGDGELDLAHRFTLGLRLGRDLWVRASELEPLPARPFVMRRREDV